MRLTSLLLLLTTACPAAQVIMRGSAGKNGVFWYGYETRVEPEIPGQKLTGFDCGGVDGENSMDRWMSDSTNKTYFGYHLSIERNAGMLRLTFLPLNLPPEKLPLRPAGAWKQIPLPRLPGPQTVRPSDTVAVDLFVHPATGQKIVDYLFFEESRPSVQVPSGAARDYTLEDVPLILSKTRLTVNGTEIRGGSVSARTRGFFFYLPGRGRYILSLAPYEALGFFKAGEVRGNKLTMTVGSDTIVIECDGPIAPGEGVFNVYVHADPSWRPNMGGDHVQFGFGNPRMLVRSER